MKLDAGFDQFFAEIVYLQEYAADALTEVA
jgi:hypothetical protein